LFLQRRAELTDFGRSRSARQIAQRMAGRLGAARRGDHERFLEEIVAEYRASARYR